MGPMAQVAVAMTIGDWHVIDGGMDNIGANNRDHWTAASDPEKAARAEEIRRCGWEVTSPIEQPLLDAGIWQPDDDTLARSITITLDENDWEFIAADLRGHATGAGANEAAESAVIDRLARLIDVALKGHRSSASIHRTASGRRL
jgi:hypothetical protein